LIPDHWKEFTDVYGGEVTLIEVRRDILLTGNCTDFPNVPARASVALNELVAIVTCLEVCSRQRADFTI
jgi:uncharacterized cupin superfamily protein